MNPGRFQATSFPRLFKRTSKPRRRKRGITSNTRKVTHFGRDIVAEPKSSRAPCIFLAFAFTPSILNIKNYYKYFNTTNTSSK